MAHGVDMPVVDVKRRATTMRSILRAAGCHAALHGHGRNHEHCSDFRVTVTKKTMQAESTKKSFAVSEKSFVFFITLQAGTCDITMVLPISASSILC